MSPTTPDDGLQKDGGVDDEDADDRRRQQMILWSDARTCGG